MEYSDLYICGKVEISDSDLSNFVELELGKIKPRTRTELLAC